MVDDLGPEGVLERVEARLGRAWEPFELSPGAAQPSAHLGVHAQPDGRSHLGLPVLLGLV